MSKKYPYIDQLLQIFRREHEKGNVENLNQFVKNQSAYKHELDLAEDQTFTEIGYPTLYRKVNKDPELKKLLGDPVAERKNNKKTENDNENDNVNDNEKEDKKDQDQKKGDDMELEDRIKDVDRIKTNNEDHKSKQNDKEVTDKNKPSKVNKDQIIKIGGLIVGGLIVGYGIYWIYNKYNEGGNMSGSREEQEEKPREQEQQYQSEFDQFPNARG